MFESKRKYLKACDTITEKKWIVISFDKRFGCLSSLNKISISNNSLYKIYETFVTKYKLFFIYNSK
jgi:hypothetical protein